MTYLFFLNVFFYKFKLKTLFKEIEIYLNRKPIGILKGFSDI